jgi:type IV pilus assembly protein PilN
MIKINLLPVREKVKGENVRRQISIGIFLVLLAVALMGFLEIKGRMERRALENKKNALNEQLAVLKREVGDLSKIEQEKKDLEKRKDTIVKLTQNMLGTVMALDDLVDAKPDSVYFVSIEQKNPGAPWEDFILVLKGVALDNEIVAQFMRNLEKFAMFKLVDLDYTKALLVKDLGLTFQEFELNLKVSQTKRPGSEPEEGAGQKR